MFLRMAFACTFVISVKLANEEKCLVLLANKAINLSIELSCIRYAKGIRSTTKKALSAVNMLIKEMPYDLLVGFLCHFKSCCHNIRRCIFGCSFSFREPNVLSNVAVNECTLYVLFSFNRILIPWLLFSEFNVFNLSLSSLARKKRMPSSAPFTTAVISSHVRDIIHL